MKIRRKDRRILSEGFAQRWRHRIQKEPGRFPFNSRERNRTHRSNAGNVQLWLVPAPHTALASGLWVLSCRYLSSGTVPGALLEGIAECDLEEAQWVELRYLSPPPASFSFPFLFSLLSHIRPCAGRGQRGRIPLPDTGLYQDTLKKKVFLLTSLSWCLTQCPAHSSDSPAVELSNCTESAE